MSAIDIFETLISKVFYLDKYRKRASLRQPGAMVTELPDAEKAELQKLTSGEVLSMRTPNAAYWCNDYYQTKELSKLSLEFDKKLGSNKV